MKIFAIIVTYNGSQWIEKCFGSLIHSSKLDCIHWCGEYYTKQYLETNFTGGLSHEKKNRFFTDCLLHPCRSDP